MTNDIETLKKRIRWLLIFFTAGLLLSGLTAFPIKVEVNILQKLFSEGSFLSRVFPPLSDWISFVHISINEVDGKYPFLFYGTDWLAFAHIVIAIAFIGPLRNPVKNIWVVEFGIIACILIIPLAMICGQIRGIPFFWRLIDCSFGVFGIIPLLLSMRYIQRLIQLQNKQET